MRVLIAPDKLKGSLSASEAALALASGARSAGPAVSTDELPLADGGEGTLDALVAALGAEVRIARVSGPLGRPVEARWGLVHATNTAIIESAEAVGLWRLAPSERNPLVTTSHGVGELVRAALDAGARTIVVGLGGSASVDAGAGMAQALGARLVGAKVPARGSDLGDITSVDRAGLDPRLEHVRVVAACDVDSPLTGPEGAALVFGPQKGASPQAARALDRALADFSRLAAGDRELASAPGAGAAGGLGFGLAVFARSELAPGAELVLDTLGFDEHLARAELVLTAEGRLDAQSGRGKLVSTVARRARQRAVPCLALAGSVALGPAEVRALGLAGAFSLCSGPTSESEATARAAELLEARAGMLVGLWLAASRAL